MQDEIRKPNQLSILSTLFIAIFLWSIISICIRFVAQPANQRTSFFIGLCLIVMVPLAIGLHASISLRKKKNWARLYLTRLTILLAVVHMFLFVTWYVRGRTLRGQLVNLRSTAESQGFEKPTMTVEQFDQTRKDGILKWGKGAVTMTLPFVLLAAILNSRKIRREFDA